MTEREPSPGKRPLSSAEVAGLEEAATKPRPWISPRVEARMLEERRLEAKELEAKRLEARMLEAKRREERMLQERMFEAMELVAKKLEAKKKNHPTLKPSDGPSCRGNQPAGRLSVAQEEWEMAGNRQPTAKGRNTHKGMGVDEYDSEEHVQKNIVPDFSIEDIRETARSLNANVLQSGDPLIKEVLMSVSTVSLHHWCPNRLIWYNKNVKGPLFLVKRSVVPIYQMVISNRKSAGNTTLDLVDDFTIEAVYPHLKFQHAVHGILAIKFYQEEELVTVVNFLVRTFGLQKNEYGAWACPKVPQQAVVSKASSVWKSFQKFDTSLILLVAVCLMFFGRKVVTAEEN